MHLKLILVQIIKFCFFPLSLSIVFIHQISDEQYNNKIQFLANTMPNPGMGNSNIRKDNRDRNDRGSMSRGGSMSGSGYNNSNKLNRGNYQDSDGWIQTGGNKGRGGNNSTAFDPTKFRASSVSVRTKIGENHTCLSCEKHCIFIYKIHYLFRTKKISQKHHWVHQINSNGS